MTTDLVWRVLAEACPRVDFHSGAELRLTNLELSRLVGLAAEMIGADARGPQTFQCPPRIGLRPRAQGSVAGRALSPSQHRDHGISLPAMFHYHQETGRFDSAINTWHVNNVVRIVPRR
jgi:hypothetical protein